MKIIGLTGGIASGKSTVSKIISTDFGYPIVDADLIARQVVTPGSEGLQCIADAFGLEYITPKGEMNRLKMGDLIRQDNEAKTKLEAITHPLIRQEVLRQFEFHRKVEREIVIYDCPLLFEAGEIELVDAVLLVVVNEEIRISRLMQRDDISEEEAKQKIAIQLSHGQKMERAKALQIPVACIDNSRGIDGLSQSIKTAFSELNL